MRILITGATGLVGSRLTEHLHSLDHHITTLGRTRGDMTWDQLTSGPLAAMNHCDAVVHLAGENIASGRWTHAKKQRIRDSRVDRTRQLAQALAACTTKPRVLVCASAIGYYGHRGDEPLIETSEPGSGYLSDLCVQWERACDPARDAGIRTVNLRIGVVLARDGGAIAKMLTPFKLGLGGVIGSGSQFMSWIAIDDLVGAIEHAMHTDRLEGPVNAVAPNAVTHRQFIQTLGRVLHRPTILPMPALIARLVFGEMADALLLASTRVVPERLQGTGCTFRYRTLEAALQAELHP